MESIKQLQKKYCSAAMTISIIAALLFIFAGQAPVGKGLLLGALFSIVNFVLMGETLPYRIGNTKYKTFFIALGSIWFRYVVLAVPLVISIKSEQFNLFSVIAGIFSVQIILLADHLIGFIPFIRRKQI